MLGLPDVAIGAVVAALVAGLVSLLGLIISKEQKISEFRQAWIDALRSEISALISHANAIHGTSAAGLERASELWKVVRPDFLGINQAAANVRLRLNPKEKEASAVLEQIEGLEQLLLPGRTVEYAQIDETEKRLVAAAQVLLKQEWLRVKQGEQVYRIARICALIVLMVCVVALFTIAVMRAATL